MKASLLNRLDTLRERFEELSALLSDAEVIQDQTRFRAYSREYAELEPTVKCYGQWLKTNADLAEARSLLKDADPDIRAMAEDDAEASTATLEQLEAQLNLLLLPKDPNDERNVFLEIRAGTGGRSGNLCRQPVSHVFALCRAAGLAHRDPVGERWRARRLSRGHRSGGRAERVRQAQVRIRRPPRAARPRDRVPGPYPYLRL